VESSTYILKLINFNKCRRKKWKELKRIRNTFSLMGVTRKLYFDW